jgi:hypothetical protein
LWFIRRLSRGKRMRSSLLSRLIGYEIKYRIW